MERKNAFRLVCILIVCVLVCISCSRPESGDGPEPVFEPEGSVDFLSEDIVLAQDVNFTTNPFGYQVDSTLYDMFMDRVSDMHQKYNCSVSVSFEQEILGQIRNAIWTATECRFDLVYMACDNLNMTGAVSGLFHSLSDSEYVDVTDYGKYGVPTLQESCMYNGTVYGVVPAALPMAASNGSGLPLVIINESLVKRFSMPDPRDMYENGSWTLDYFNDHIKDYYADDGSDTVNSVITHLECWGSGYIGSYGIRMYGDYRGETYTCFNHPLITEALSKSVSCRENNRDYLNIVGYWSFCDDFCMGKDVMCLGHDGMISQVCRELDDFGLVLFPVSDYIQNGSQYAYFSAISTLSIPFCADEPEGLSFIVSEMLEPYDGYDRNSYADLLYTTSFYDRRDVDVFLDFPLNECFNYYAFGGSGFLGAICAVDSSQSVKQVLDSNKEKFDAVVEKYVAANYEKVIKPYLDSLYR